MNSNQSINMKPNGIKFLLLIVLLALPPTLHALTSRDIEGGIMCICKDNCGKVLENCTCGTADIFRKEIREMIAAGKVKKEIIDHYVERFGEKILSSPTKEGFNLVAWITPFLAIFAGGWGVNRIVRSWAKKRTSKTLAENSHEETPGTEEKESPYKKRMEEELREFDS